MSNVILFARRGSGEPLEPVSTPCGPDIGPEKADARKVSGARPKRCRGGRRSKRWRAAIGEAKDIPIPIPHELAMATHWPQDVALNMRRHGRRSGPIVLIVSDVDAGRIVSGPLGWWSDVVALDGAIDLYRYNVLSVDFTSPHAERRAASGDDDAQLLAHALDYLGLDHVHAVIGVGRGCEVSVALAAAAWSTRVGGVCAIVNADAVGSAFALPFSVKPESPATTLVVKDGSAARVIARSIGRSISPHTIGASSDRFWPTRAPQRLAPILRDFLSDVNRSDA